MKKIILAIGILTSINIYGADKAECEELFRSAIYNFYLENSCKLNKHLSSAIRNKFGDKNCPELFTKEDMKNLNSEVLGNTYRKMNEVGRDKFCQNNRAKYDELATEK